MCAAPSARANATASPAPDTNVAAAVAEAPALSADQPTTETNRSDRHGCISPIPVHPCRCGGPPWEVSTITADTTAADRRATLDRAARLGQLSTTDQDLIRIASDPHFGRWLEQITATGGCAHPIYLSGSTTTFDAVTGEVLHHYDTTHEPGGRLAIRCRNRRETVCPPCSRLHAGDTFHLVRAGLLGGKNVPTGVRARPRLFVTLTAPSFGPVHRSADGERCRRRRRASVCEHGVPLGCSAVHADGDPLVGQPLCAACYDYTGHVLWHAHAGELWDRFARAVRRSLATAAGITQSRFPEHARLSFAKVAEYQRRAAVHLHAVVRLDGPDGPDDPPPSWATTERIAAAVRTAARSVVVRTRYSPALGEHGLHWGAQLDARPLHSIDDVSGPVDDAVAAYIAKYVTKGAGSTGSTGGTDYRLNTRDDIDHAQVTPHVRTLMHTCWRLGALPELEPLRLRSWAHTLGYRGHILTKSRAYSTTYAALRAQRAVHERAGTDLPEDSDDTIAEAHWRYVGSGHTPGAALIAAGVAYERARNREIAREELGKARRVGA